MKFDAIRVQKEIEHYAPADESLLVGLTALWVEGGMQYYGYL
jgi:hypothetical protein